VTITSFENTTLKRAKVDVQGVLLTEDDNGRVHLTGEVVNNGKEPVKIHGLAAITTDSDGKMEAADYYSVLIHYLSPGKSGPFRVSMGAPKDGPTAKDWTIYLDAEATTSADFLISAADDLTDVSEFFDANGNFHMAAELTNSSQQNIGVRLLATLYDKDGNVLDAAMTDTAISAIAPGEKIPFEFDYWGPVAYKQGVYDAYDKWRVQIDPVWTFSTKTKLVDLTDTIKDDSNTFDDTQGIFKGTVVNSSGGDLDSIVVIVGIWPKKGQPDAGQVLAMGYSYADISDKLAKGKSADFTVYVPIPKGLNIDNYEYGMIAKGHAP
jgi:hypothetical protein